MDINQHRFSLVGQFIGCVSSFIVGHFIRAAQFCCRTTFHFVHERSAAAHNTVHKLWRGTLLLIVHLSIFVLATVDNVSVETPQLMHRRCGAFTFDDEVTNIITRTDVHV